MEHSCPDSCTVPRRLQPSALKVYSYSKEQSPVQNWSMESDYPWQDGPGDKRKGGVEEKQKKLQVTLDLSCLKTLEHQPPIRLPT